MRLIFRLFLFFCLACVVPAQDELDDLLGDEDVFGDEEFLGDDDLLGDDGLGRPLFGQENRIELQVTAQREIEEVDDEGEVELVRIFAKKILPGDEVIYTIEYSNIGYDAADRVGVTCPLPEGMRYRKFSAAGDGAEILFSIDDGHTFDEPANLIVRNDEGDVAKAKTRHYTHIRWRLLKHVAAGSSGSVSFRATLESKAFPPPQGNVIEAVEALQSNDSSENRSNEENFRGTVEELLSAGFSDYRVREGDVRLAEIIERLKIKQHNTINRPMGQAGYSIEWRRRFAIRAMVNQGYSKRKAIVTVRDMEEHGLLPDPPR
jgi:uncharacterized repeat protein (TIGR01451 family)